LSGKKNQNHKGTLRSLQRKIVEIEVEVEKSINHKGAQRKKSR
jgi:hypothetical protein